MHYDILTGMTFFPCLGILVLLAWRRLDEEWACRIALAASVAPWAFVGRILSLNQPSWGGFQFESRLLRNPRFLADSHTALDGFSIGLLLLVSMLIPLAILAAWQTRISAQPRPSTATRFHLVLILLAQTSLYGVLTTINLLHAFVFWEVLIVVTFFLLERPQDERANLAARQFLIHALVGSAMIWCSLQFLRIATGSWDLTTLVAMAHPGAVPGDQSVLALRIRETAIQLGMPALSGNAARLVFGLIAGGILIQAPVWPFHGWLPTAATRAPTYSVILLTGIVCQVSVFVFLRVVLSIFENLVFEHHGILLGLISATIVFSSVAAVVQDDLRKLAAYTSLTGTAICLLGIVAAVMPTTSANDPALALNGVLVQMFAQGLGLAGFYYVADFTSKHLSVEQSGRVDVSRDTTIWRRGLMGIILLTLSGLPGFAGFVSLFLILRGAFFSATDATVVAVLGLLVTGIGLFRAASRILIVPRNQQPEEMIELKWNEKAAGMAIVAVLLIFGIFPGGLVTLANATVVKFLTGP